MLRASARHAAAGPVSWRQRKSMTGRYEHVFVLSMVRTRSRPVVPDGPPDYDRARRTEPGQRPEHVTLWYV
jgi:hypothetical protein